VVVVQLHVLILGVAAGGGLPQWNCGCENCNRARRGEIPSLTQSSIAVSADGAHWVVLNASPDIRTQLAASPPLHPTGPRVSPIVGVLVTNGDIDHVAGLLTLRESQTFTLYGTAEILDVIGANPIFDALAPSSVTRQAIALETSFDLAPGLSATLFAVPGKIPLYLEGSDVRTDLEGEQTVGVELTAGGATAFYIPGCARMTQRLEDRLRGAGLVFFDGTVWRDDEMISAGVGQKTGARMGHMAMSGAQGSIAAFASLGVARKVFVHMNNTNPVLDPASPERAEAEAAGWAVGMDGMELQV
jgi:pyrroloquinoline quinone biosynthesis protein B